MTLIERLFGLFEHDSETPQYRCIQCGEGYERSQRECDVCGSQFIAEASDGEDDSSKPAEPDRFP